MFIFRMRLEARKMNRISWKPRMCFIRCGKLYGLQYLGNYTVCVVTCKASRYCCKFIRHSSQQLTRWSEVFLRKLIIAYVVKTYSTLSGAWRFSTVLTRVRHLSLSLARLIQSIPSHLVCLRSVSILSSHVRLALAWGLFPADFATNFFLFISHLSRVLCMSHLPHPLDLISAKYLVKITNYEGQYRK
jgi:hypothetical protein